MAHNKQHLSCVNGKIKCIFKPKIIEEQSNKRHGQSYKVIASNQLEDEFLNKLQEGSLTASEKIDGTCCLVDLFNSRPWLWARHDVKPMKGAMKRFKDFQSEKNRRSANEESTEGMEFIWNKLEDFKEKPDHWKPASGVPPDEAEPDDIGHMVGWVPVDPSLRTHLWHLSVLDLNNGLALCLSPSGEVDEMKIHTMKLSDHVGETFELIGSNVNANPYGIGGKKNPIHFLTRHGEFHLKNLSCDINISRDAMYEFFESSGGQLEGIVWHGPQNFLYKLHRHHLDLKWPITAPRISNFHILVDIFGEKEHFQRNKLFQTFFRLNGRKFEKFTDLAADCT